jgi:pimeloyl-ACP methyl ester carboxylesterase
MNNIQNKKLYKVKNQSAIVAQEHYTSAFVISKDGTRIGYRQLGQGPGLVILHGGMESFQSHVQLAEALADTYTVYLPDRRGRGLSGPYGQNYGVQREVEDLDALLVRTGAHNVFGFSSAAIVLLHAALRQPAIQKVVIFEPPLFNVTDDWLPRYDQEIAEGKVAAALVTSTKGTQMWGHTMPRWLLELAAKMIMASEDKKAKGNDVTTRKLAPTLHYDAQLIIESKGAIESFKTIRTDVLLMGGSMSPDFLKAGLDALEKVLPDSRRVEIPGAGHGASGNTDRGGKPKVVAQELRRFFG